MKKDFNHSLSFEEIQEMDISEVKGYLERYAQLIGFQLFHYVEHEVTDYSKVTYIGCSTTKNLKRGAFYTARGDKEQQLRSMFYDFLEWGYFRIENGKIIDTFNPNP